MRLRFINNILLVTLLAVCVLFCSAQTSFKEMSADLNLSGGVYLAYPVPTAPQTPAPEGYRPFYISHYGRHGSRYLIGDEDYKWLVDLFATADSVNALTPLGTDVYRRLTLVWDEAEGHGGDLSPVGVRQEQGIAERMYASFPEVFPPGAAVSARSTVSLRCAMSMAAFGDKLKELSPGIRISYEASRKYMDYMNFHTEASNLFTADDGLWAEEYRKFTESHTKADRLTASLFSSEDFILKRVNPSDLMWGLYWVASGMQDIETDVSFYDIFLPEELFDLWQCVNYRFYVCNANHAAGKGIVTANAVPLLRNILSGADEAVAGRGETATLRFGHDGNLIPLLALMGVENFNVSADDPYEVYKVWCDFRAAPMAANLQLVFFRKDGGTADDVLVKVLHNETEVHIPIETDCFPFYRWSDVRRFYKGIAGDW